MTKTLTLHQPSWTWDYVYGPLLKQNPKLVEDLEFLLRIGVLKWRPVRVGAVPNISGLYLSDIEKLLPGRIDGSNEIGKQQRRSPARDGVRKQSRGTSSRPVGRPPDKRNPIEEKMRDDLRKKRLSPNDLRDMKEEALAANYNCKRGVGRAARSTVLSEKEFSTNSDN